ncbi:MAG: hypothetical protein WDZ53_07010 [Balneolales bacterium]
MRDECPLIEAGTRLDWDIPDPRHADPGEFRAIRDLIGQKVKQLLGT